MGNQYEPDYCVPPTATLKTLMAERGWGVAELASRMGMPVVNVEAIIDGRQPLTAMVALRLEDATSVPASFWIQRRLQWDAQKRSEKEGA